MKKTRKTALTAMMFATALSFSGCRTQEFMQTDYGPPPDFPEPAETITESLAENEPSFQDTEETTEFGD